ncbi:MULTISPECIES: ArsR/SmtB family transcription factor [Streptomyces]|uniref:ArsR/SmtB family transcription factor n=1 Tax=Streptomyces TaxID=1883 RepID=UPI0004CCD949|nr:MULTISPECIES: metalloregulator ArsR/SmtB family transcription factor [Streptomyces]MBK3584494.1 winged helix-turn-helix transcriptional regulator [Streptomyces sp. MBT57]OXZ02250.1 transcriptional regulator [Streptomyces sp. 2R]WSR89626.1 metalloregulator ArsR/SmtB family transcription factor [Streptomyces microflavus]WTF67592.1 metalloregulator ArsR/SmtB family transcription factor [Streptomyces microflavus]
MNRMRALSTTPFVDGPAVESCCPPLSERPLSSDEAEAAAQLFKALGDPIRLRLLSAIASHKDGEACVCDVSDVGVSQPTVSHHLRRLREAGLLISERRGTWIYYRVDPARLAAMGRILSAASAEA